MPYDTRPRNAATGEASSLGTGPSGWGSVAGSSSSVARAPYSTVRLTSSTEDSTASS